MKFRLISRKRGYVIQRPRTNRDEHRETGAQFADYDAVVPGKWHDHTIHRIRWLASLHLWWLRERNRP